MFSALAKKNEPCETGIMKRRRTISDLTVADLRALGLSHSFISRLRNRLCRPSLPVAVEIERTYGIPPRAWLEPAQ
ncbi:helix-turn-helix transcriptional regulator [Phenylobacterium sp.]|uniref:helix-turn-helix domain-containing protein n=1 Tax=Phenylobacterium sp. TaxID=1871053 RepID=UPI0025CC79A7|nr:helix-turn-helix transcriptional regulator [Phenylobacterium sp.]MCA3505066.1 helix-turn-helix transcriptional regulator [Rhodobacter sp.]MCA3731940.1 helix-turn-helix transcriptional regulator [Phenylobacterium sp.]MCA3750614.1 helix-turn-helix transcriptional regulator [Phenylobacterium sp.]MCA6236835.1 helix-turn-helix transcriptional regulator [Phenylobacterium sp.]MCA6360565.1 helix-turn-helix transcriptional regulator [Phenylobacterium sp.]